MIFSDDGQMVSMTITEYGELNGRIAQVTREASERVSIAEGQRSVAERLMAEAMNKEPLVRVQDDLTNALNIREDAAAQVVRMAEHFISEVYHVQGGVSRTNRTEIAAKMSQLRKSIPRSEPPVDSRSSV